MKKTLALALSALLLTGLLCACMPNYNTQPFHKVYGFVPGGAAVLWIGADGQPLDPLPDSMEYQIFEDGGFVVERVREGDTTRYRVGDELYTREEIAARGTAYEVAAVPFTSSVRTSVYYYLEHGGYIVLFEDGRGSFSITGVYNTKTGAPVPKYSVNASQGATAMGGETIVYACAEYLLLADEFYYTGREQRLLKLVLGDAIYPMDTQPEDGDYTWSPANIGCEAGMLYMLLQNCSTNTTQGVYNLVDSAHHGDALFRLDPDTGTGETLFTAGEGQRIVAYQNGALLLFEDGIILRHDLQAGQAAEIGSVKQCAQYVSQTYGGTLYIWGKGRHASNWQLLGTFPIAA